MSKSMIVVAALIGAAGLGPAGAADLGVSISLGQPGFYGRLDIGDYPQPEIIYRRPVLIERVPRGEVRQPLYLHVPPGHERRWRQHCAQYNACGQPVYFVRDKWYQQTYVSRYREHHRDEAGRDQGRGHGHEHDRDRDHDQSQH